MDDELTVTTSGTSASTRHPASGAVGCTTHVRGDVTTMRAAAKVRARVRTVALVERTEETPGQTRTPFPVRLLDVGMT